MLKSTIRSGFRASPMPLPCPFSMQTANVDAGCQRVKNGRNQWEYYTRPSGRGELHAHARIADGRRLTTRRRPQVGLLSTATRCCNSDPPRFNVAFVADREGEEKKKSPDLWLLHRLHPQLQPPTSYYRMTFNPSTAMLFLKCVFFLRVMESKTPRHGWGEVEDVVKMSETRNDASFL